MTKTEYIQQKNTHRITGFMNFVHHLKFQFTKNTTFPSDEGRETLTLLAVSSNKYELGADIMKIMCISRACYLLHVDSLLAYP
jgi:hypothetical protein